MSGPALIILFLASMVYLFVTIVRFKMNPFFSMISAAIAIGVLAGMDLNELVNGITSGFGSICAGWALLLPWASFSAACFPKPERPTLWPTRR